jgi:hypothetical protein
MNNKKDYQLLWEGFVSNKRIRLNEMEERYMDLISNATSYAQRHPQLLPFPQVFGNDLRKVIPFEQKNVDKIAYLLTTLKMFQRTNEWTQYLTPEVQSTTVKVKKQRQAGAGGGTYEEDQTLKQIVIQHSFTDQQGNKKTRSLSVVNGLKLLNTGLKRTGEKLKNREIINYALSLADIEKITEVIPRMIDWWQKNQSKINQDPEVAQLAVDQYSKLYDFDWTKFDTVDDNQGAGEVSSKYSIILSRVPVDVLRMSDHDNIESCHSQPKNYGTGGYFYCAIAEAQNEGAIAYLVYTEDLENIDIRSPEIFKDRERGVKGIQPISRIRLRTLKDTEKDQTIAVPERRTYGPFINGFEEFVRTQMASQQKDLFVTQTEDGKKGLTLPQITKLTRIGGSYQDSQIGGNFKLLIDKIVEEEGIQPTEELTAVIKDIEMHYVRYAGKDTQYQSVSGDDDDDDEDQQREAAEQEYYRQIRRGERNANYFSFNSSEFDWEWGDGPNMIFVANASIPIATSLINKKYFTDSGLDREQLSNAIVEAIKDNADGSDINPPFIYPDAEISEGNCWVEGDRDSKFITFHLYYEERRVNELNSFESHITDFIRFSNLIRDSNTTIEEMLEVYLSDNDIIGEGAEGVNIGQYVAQFKKYVEISNTTHFVDVGDNKFEFRPKVQSHTPDPSKNKWLMAKIDIGDYTEDLRYSLRNLATAMTYNFTQQQEAKISKVYYNLSNRQLGMFKADYGFQQIDPDLFSEFTEQEKFSFNSFNNVFDIQISTAFMTEDMKVVDYDPNADINGAKIIGIYALPSIRISPKLNANEKLSLIKYMYLMDEDPEQFIDLLHSSFKQAINGSNSLKAAINKLTERRKRVIKERLKNWYRKNKGII